MNSIIDVWHGHKYAQEVYYESICEYNKQVVFKAVVMQLKKLQDEFQKKIVFLFLVKLKVSTKLNLKKYRLWFEWIYID